MPKVFNLLPNADAFLKIDEFGIQVLLSDLQTGWEAVDLQNQEITTEVQSENFSVSSRYVLVIYPNTIQPIKIRLVSTPLYLSDNGRPLSFNAKLKCSSQIITSTKLYIDDNSSVDPYTQSLSSGKYNAIHSHTSIVEDDEDNHTATIEINVSGHGQNPIFFTCPHLIHDLAFANNPMIGLIRRYLPDFYWEFDSQSSNPTFPFFKFIDALTHAIGDTRLEYGSLYGFELDQLQNPDWIPEYWTNSVMTDINYVRDDYIPWLSLFTGEHVIQNVQNKNGDYYFENAASIRDFMEFQLRTRSFGSNSGTRGSIINSIKQVLIKTKNNQTATRVVALTQNFGGDPFAIRVKTLVNETDDVTGVGESSYLVLSAAEKARPMGYKITHSSEAQFVFTLDDATLGVLNTGFPLG